MKLPFARQIEGFRIIDVVSGLVSLQVEVTLYTDGEFTLSCKNGLLKYSSAKTLNEAEAKAREILKEQLLAAVEQL